MYCVAGNIKFDFIEFFFITYIAKDCDLYYDGNESNFTLL